MSTTAPATHAPDAPSAFSAPPTRERCWFEQKMCGFDLETTGVDVHNDRIVTAAIVWIDPNHPDPAQRVQRHEWLVNPRIDIPEGATAVHGISTGHAREHGVDPKVAIAQINEHLRQAREQGYSVTGYNLAYDMSLLHAESTREGLEPVEEVYVADAFVMDKHVAPFRRGRRDLNTVTALYGEKFDGDAHNATNDVIASVRVARRIGTRYPEMQVSAAELHEKQKTWYAEQQADFQKYLRTKKIDPQPDATCPPQWPIRLPEDDPDANNSPLLAGRSTGAGRPSFPTYDIAAGRYALTTEEGEMRFFRVARPTEGKYAGRTFLEEQSGDTYEPIRGADAYPFLDKIKADPFGAQIAYGHATGVCARCGRSLTDPASVEAGMGPECRSRVA